MALALFLSVVGHRDDALQSDKSFAQFLLVSQIIKKRIGFTLLNIF